MVAVPDRMRGRQLVCRHQQRSRGTAARACCRHRRALHARSRSVPVDRTAGVPGPRDGLARRVAAQTPAAAAQAGVFRRRLTRSDHPVGATGGRQCLGAAVARAGPGRPHRRSLYSAQLRTSHRSPMPSPKPDRPTIALAAGGTGGHLFPAEALARELMARGHEVVIHTERRGAQYAQALAGIPHVVLPASSLEGGIAAKAGAALSILRGVLASRRDLQRRRAALMVGFGGYPSFAPALAARSLGLPLLLHEQATRLSKANAQLLRFAAGLATSFPAVAGTEGFDAARIVETGNPVRQAILA